MILDDLIFESVDAIKLESTRERHCAINGDASVVCSPNRAFEIHCHHTVRRQRQGTIHLQ